MPIEGFIVLAFLPSPEFLLLTKLLLGIGFYTIQYKISTRGRRGGNRLILSLACFGKRG